MHIRKVQENLPHEGMETINLRARSISFFGQVDAFKPLLDTKAGVLLHLGVGRWHGAFGCVETLRMMGDGI